MARLSLDNFPQPQSGWKDWHKFALIGLTVGIALFAWHWVTRADEKRKQAQAKMAESDEKLKAAEQEKAVREKTTTTLTGQAVADAINLITTVAIKKAQNPPNTEG
jgi:hypothetical protein